MKKIEKFFAAEIGIEFKAALYFYSMLFFYMGYQIIKGSFDADIIVILEMIAATYAMGFVQVFLLQNFDESESITFKAVIKAVLCSVVYTFMSWLLGWFDRNIIITAAFLVFVIGCYGCTYWLYSFRRSVSTKELNRELEEFKNKKTN